MAGKLDNVDHHLFERVWKELSELAAAERHFNTLESSYRMLASTWLLATFGGAGFVLTADRLQLPFDKLWLVVAIGLAGCSGITLLWNLDLMVYHQLLHANFREGERLEGAYDWVPKVRTRMRASQPGRSALRRVIWFYIGGVTAALAVAAGASLLLLAQARYSAPTILAAATAWGAVAVALAHVLYRTTLDAQEPEQQGTPALGDSASTVARPVAPAK